MERFSSGLKMYQTTLQNWNDYVTLKSIQVKSGQSDTEAEYKNFIYDDDAVKYGWNMVKTQIYGHEWPH